MNRLGQWIGGRLARRLSVQAHVCGSSPATDMNLLANVIDLARYLIPTPPVPRGWRRGMLALGSGDPTRAICSTLIAQCFQAVRYPILPIVSRRSIDSLGCPGCWTEVLKIRHHSLFVPRDFDVSPYFEVVKPTLVAGFDYRRAEWAESAVVETMGR